MATQRVTYSEFIAAWETAGSPPVLYETTPTGIEGWEVECGAQGVSSFSPPHLEHVTMFIERGGERFEHVLFDRSGIQ